MRAVTAVLFLLICVIAPNAGDRPAADTPDARAKSAAERMNAAAKSRLAPVYPALAEWIVARYDLEGKKGIGIDLGGGPGDLILELCARTETMYWINADINPFNFRFMYASAVQSGMEHRVGAVSADAHAMPFRDDYADIVVSRGTFQFWDDKPEAFREVRRILKPGGTALVGRGYSENLPPEVAAEIRSAHGDGGPEYEIAETAEELRAIMEEIGVEDYEIVVPKYDEKPEIKYGIWLEFRKTP